MLNIKLPGRNLLGDGFQNRAMKILISIKVLIVARLVFDSMTMGGEWIRISDSGSRRNPYTAE